MNNNQPLIHFNPKLPRLSESEKKVLKLLVEAGELIAPLYLEQEKQAKDISQEEIEKAAKKDPELLSPYTFVENANGQLVATPYHIKYEKFLKPIAEKLNKASKITDDKGFGKFLKLQAKALLDGTYEKAIAAWLNIKPYTLDIQIGPLQHFDKELFKGKAAYQAWVGVLDVEGTKRLFNYKNVILSTRRNAIIPGDRVENYEKVKTKVDEVILFSGHMARTRFIGINLPMNLTLYKKYGSEVTLFNQANDIRMKEQTMPIFKKIFSPDFRSGFSSEDIRRASLRYVAFHEIAHNYLYYRNAFRNLQDLLPIIYELCATLLGMRIAGSLLLKEVITSKQLESMIIAFICRSYYLMEKSKVNKSVINYARSGQIFINYMVENEALKKYKGLTIPNFMKIFVSIHDLSYTLEHLLSSGSRKDAENFIKKYSNLKNTY